MHWEMELRSDGSNNGDIAEAISNIVLDDQRGSRLCNLSASREVKIYKPDRAPLWERYFCSDFCHTYSSMKNHSSASFRLIAFSRR